METAPCTCELEKPKVRSDTSTTCSRCHGHLIAWIPEAAADEAMNAGALPTAQVLERTFRMDGRAVRAIVSPALGFWFARCGQAAAAGVVRDLVGGRRRR